MWRTAVIFHIFIAPTIMGAFMLAVMMVPSLQFDLGRWIVIAAVAGFVAAIPVSVIAAKASSRKLA